MELVFFIGWFITGVIVPFVVKRFRPMLLRSVRFLATYIATFMIGISVIIGMALNDLEIFVICMIISMWGGVQMLFLPKKSPKLAKKFDLEW
jgi:hypothetical protein